MRGKYYYNFYNLKILVPVCPQRPGEFYIKALIKIEEESKYKEIEIKRFIIKLNVKPSVKFQVQEEISSYDQESINFNLKVNACVESRVSISSMTIQDVYYHERYSLSRDFNWKLLENENYTKLYSVMKMKKSKIYDSNTCDIMRNVLSKSKNMLIDSSISDGVSAASSTVASSIFENILDKKFKFLPEFASDSNSHSIIEKFDNLLSKDKLLFHFTGIDNSDEDRVVNGLLIYENTINIPQISKNFLKTIFVNSIEVIISLNSNNTADNQRMICIDIKLDKKGLSEISDVKAYEVYVNDEDYEFNWIGATRYKIINSKSEAEELKENLNFCFLTSKREAFEMSKICVGIIPKNSNDKPYVLSNVLRSIDIDV